MSYVEHLSALLGAYAPLDARERGYRSRMLELAARPDALERTHYEPGHFTASAFVLSPGRDAVLLIYHGKLLRWLQPGGHVEPSDAAPLETARRELLEEVAVTELLPAIDSGIFDIDVHPIPERPREPAHEHFDLRFLFVATSRDFSAGSEVRGARWVPLPELPGVTTDESVLRAVRKLL